jgi:hypothetical protein
MWGGLVQEYVVMQCHALAGVLGSGKYGLQIDRPLGE